jgi:leucyl aminopeptidase
MKYKLDGTTLSEAKADVVVLGIFQGENVADVLQALDGKFSDSDHFLQLIADAAREDKFLGKTGQMASFPTYGQIRAKKLFLAGLGPARSSNPAQARKLSANLARRFKSGMTPERVIFFLRAEAMPGTADSVTGRSRSSASASPKRKAKPKTPPTPADISGADAEAYAQAIVEGWKLGSYSFDKYKSGKKDLNGHTGELTIGFNGLKLTEKQLAAACTAGDVIAEATNLARRLIAEPASYMTPSRLAEEARAIAKSGTLTCKVLDSAQMEKLGMGSILGVARGAKEPPRFIVLKYVASTSKRTIALVGKGVTFDSGGLSLKPAQSMEHMKYDMSGAAAVIATMQVVSKLKPNVSVLGVVAATENMPGDGALHPGDVLTSMNGKTIEVNNTDAEGRLVLADALTYSCRQGADELIDIATLTGAVVSALGRVAAGIMGSDQKLVDNLIAAGQRAGEKLWQLPLFDEYKEGLKSDIADLKNAGSRGEAASSSAGMFLKEFVDGKPWAHLDICGPGWLDKDRDECNKGGTAFGVRTLSHYLLGL